MLGFASVKVFTYWRDNKYQPLSDLRQDVATEMGIDLKAMDKMRPKAQPTTPEDAKMNKLNHLEKKKSNSCDGFTTRVQKEIS